MKRKHHDTLRMTRRKRIKLASVERTERALLSEFPEISNFSTAIRDAVIGSYLDDLEANRRSLRGPARSKEEISGYYQQAIALYQLLKDPRPHHLAYLNGLDLAELEGVGIVRKRLIERIEWSKRISTTRKVVFGHLWKNIAAFADPSGAKRLQDAYPNLIPEVSLY